VPFEELPRLRAPLDGLTFTPCRGSDFAQDEQRVRHVVACAAALKCRQRRGRQRLGVSLVGITVSFLVREPGSRLTADSKRNCNQNCNQIRIDDAHDRHNVAGNTGWGGWGSNPRPTDYESAALTG
jgi:hypothetical protein